MIFLLFVLSIQATPLEPIHRKQYSRGSCDVDLTLDPISKHGVNSHSIAYSALNNASRIFQQPFGFDVSNIKHLSSSLGSDAGTSLSKFKQLTNRAQSSNARKP